MKQFHLLEDNHRIDLIQSGHFRGTSLNGQIEEMRLPANAGEWKSTAVWEIIQTWSCVAAAFPGSLEWARCHVRGWASRDEQAPRSPQGGQTAW